MERALSSFIGPLVLALSCGSALGQERATKLLTVKISPQEGGFLGLVQGDGPLQYRVVEEQNPAQRLILDVLGVSNPLRHYYPDQHPFLERILMYEYPPSTNPQGTGPLARIVFELKKEMGYQIENKENELHVSFGAKAPAKPSKGNGAATAKPPVDADLPSRATAEIYDPLVPPRVAIEPADVPVSFFFQASTDGAADYKLGPEDVIEIRVFELDQLNRTVRVSGDGKIELPLVGSIRVTGLTSNEVASQIAERLKDRYVQNPQVSIFITEFLSQKVSLLGAVATPASYPLSGQRRLLQLLAEAGSLGPEAGNTLYVFRQTEDGRSARLTVPLNELLLQGDPRWNILLEPGDVISVPPEEAIAVTVLGAVT
ncbi:MAG: polysaccharide biosynthesis/export family protein, partial [Vicinamibacteria bacterium]